MIRPIALVLGSLLVGTAAAADSCDSCGHEHGQLVRKTIMVPTLVTETRLKSKVVTKTVEREETYTVFKRVPVKQKFEKETCYLEDEIKTQMITQKKCHRVKNPVFRTYAVNVPVEEIRETVRHREVCTECGKICVEEPCTCKITRMKKDLRSTQYEVDDVVFETIKKEISYCIKVPKTRKEFCAEEITYKLQPIEKTRKVQVCVPEIVKVPVEMCYTKMIPKVIYCCEKCAHSH